MADLYKDPSDKSADAVPPTGANGEATQSSPPDAAARLNPFDVKRLRLAAVDPTTIGVEELLTEVRYKKTPSRDSFFRVHPSPEYTARVGLIELSGRDDYYFVDPQLWVSLAGEKTFGFRQVFTCVTVQAELFLWGCRLPGADGKQPPWVTIPLEAAREAQQRWVRLFWDEGQRKHRILLATAQHTEPQWPTKPLDELLRLAFSDDPILALDHPVLKKLRGES
jgi:hypothetical protein